MSISILYNGCYGGFGISEDALKMYNIKQKEMNPEFESITCGYLLSRHDPILVEIYHELGEKFNSKYSNIKIESIQDKYIEFYIIEEYDGLENVKIDYNAYKLEQIKNIVNSTIDNDEKINNIKLFF